MSLLLPIGVILVLVLIAKKLLDATAKRSRLPLPPGPKPKSLIGNLLDIPIVNASEKYAEWGSNFVFASALGNHILVINKREDADELFERRARKYSDRPVISVIKLMGCEYNSAIMRYGNDWRMHRRIYQENFRRETIQKFYNWRKCTDSLLSISIPMEMYGHEIKSIDDPCIVAADRSVMLGAGLVLPGKTPINLFPALGRIPAWFLFAKSQRIAAEVLKLTEEMKQIPTDFVKKRLTEGTAVNAIHPAVLSSTCRGYYITFSHPPG